uniref:Uncharacterized protein n=1 Tax=Rhizophora mucronata TaxID=61149 RepID=A0A2P2LZU5_RHIMU
MTWICNTFFWIEGRYMSALKCLEFLYQDMLLSIENIQINIWTISLRKKILLRFTETAFGSRLWRSQLMGMTIAS